MIDIDYKAGWEQGELRIAELEALVFEAFDTMASAAARHDNKADKAKGHQPHIFHREKADRLNHWLDRASPIYNEQKRRLGVGAAHG